MWHQSSKPEDSGSRKRHLYFLGIDGGGTGTRALISDGARVIGAGFGDSSNPVKVGLEQALSQVTRAVQVACEEAHLELDEIDAACAALAGVGTTRQVYERVKEGLHHALGIRKLELVTDVQAALHGALDGLPGVVVVAGTGSVALGVNASGQCSSSGGWGPILADQGSGYEIGRKALRAITASMDKRRKPGKLGKRICEKLGVTSPKELPGVLYQEDSPDIASLAKVVAAVACEGDEQARDILGRAGLELARLALLVMRKINLDEDDLRVSYVGSVFRSDFVLDAFRKLVQRAAPGVEVRRPIHLPAVGAIKLAKALPSSGSMEGLVGLPRPLVCSFLEDRWVDK